MTEESQDQDSRLEQLAQKLDNARERLATTRTFAKTTQTSRVLDLIRRIMLLPGGISLIYKQIEALEEAGIFAGSDWAYPHLLQSSMAANTITIGSSQTIILECLSELRMTAVANGHYVHPSISAEDCKIFLTQVLALNMRVMFGQFTEAERIHLGHLAPLVQAHEQFIAEEIGIGGIVEELIREIWRILAQRPIEVEHVKQMITNVAVYISSEDNDVAVGQCSGAERLISALYGPTRGCQEDPGLGVYEERLATMDTQTLRMEAMGFGRAMHDTGLVSPYHTIFIRYLRGRYDDLIPSALGLSSTGIDALFCYSDLMYHLMDEAVWPETAQCVYGLAALLERGILYSPAVAPALWRQYALEPSTDAIRLMGLAAESQPTPRQRLLAGAICVLGHPLGIGQGNNPTCQSARALSMWAAVCPDYLLQVLAWAARDDNVVMYFEGQRLSSQELLSKQPAMPLVDVDPVSAVTVPHLDAIYLAMGRLCVARGEDPHRWVNPEFHGWWCGRGFAIAVDIATGTLSDFEAFIRRFYACYHPIYNGNLPVIHPQPAGIAITDNVARFIGWHAIAIQRVGMDPEGVMRVYFFNPNNDSGQDWGNGVVVSTEGYGERFGESSLPFEQFLSRLYIFHYDPLEERDEVHIPDAEMQQVIELAQSSWAVDRIPPLGTVAESQAPTIQGPV